MINVGCNIVQPQAHTEFQNMSFLSICGVLRFARVWQFSCLIPPPQNFAKQSIMPHYMLLFSVDKTLRYFDYMYGNM